MTTLTFAAKRLVLTMSGPVSIDDTTLTMVFQGDLSELTYSITNNSTDLLPVVDLGTDPFSVRVGMGTISSLATLHLGSSAWMDGGQTFMTDSLWLAMPEDESIVTYWVDLAGTPTPLLDSIQAASRWSPEAQAYLPLTTVEEGENLLNAGYQNPASSLAALEITEDDHFVGTKVGDTIFGGLGDDILKGRDGADDLDGGAGADRIYAGLGDDKVNGGDDNDRIKGDFGDDILRGGNGDDVIIGEVGEDTLRGNAGHDRLMGGLGSDRLFGDAGDDYLTGGASADRLDGGDGVDLLKGNSGADRLLGGSGADSLFGGAGDDYLDGGNSSDILNGNKGNDRLLGGNGGDRISGGRNNDVLIGGGGSDTMEGGNGRDVLVGGNGHDRLYGGSGRDTFVFFSSDTETGFDRIKDFSDGIDKIDLTDFGLESFEDVLLLANPHSDGLRLTFEDGPDGSAHVVIVEGFDLAMFTSDDVLI